VGCHDFSVSARRAVVIVVLALTAVASTVVLARQSQWWCHRVAAPIALVCNVLAITSSAT
jgi:hypothetical protein